MCLLLQHSRLSSILAKSFSPASSPAARQLETPASAQAYSRDSGYAQRHLQWVWVGG